MQKLQVGDYIRWIDRDDERRYGYVAAFIPKGTPISAAYRISVTRPDQKRICNKQRIARRDDRWIIDCGIDVIGKDDNGVPIKDVVYRILPDWNTSAVVLTDFAHN